jgi:triosephosphate isomerase
MMRCRLVVGNWKMHGSVASVADLLSGLNNQVSIKETAAMAVCPPFVFLPQVAGALADSAIQWGAQNLCQQAEGAYTGEVSGDMLSEFGCRFVLVGHSERRSLYGESDQIVAQKFVAAQSSGLTPILCLGETLEQRDTGNALAIVAEQLQVVIDIAGVQALADAVIAYEPVWAIGTGKTASSAQAQEVHQHLRQVIAGIDASIAEKVQILYGGSVKADNAIELFGQNDIDGALVGGASLKVKEFAAIYEAAV